MTSQQTIVVSTKASFLWRLLPVCEIIYFNEYKIVFSVPHENLMFKNGEFYLGSLSKQGNNFIFKILEMSSKMLKHRYFYPTNLFVAKYDTIVHDFFPMFARLNI